MNWGPPPIPIRPPKRPSLLMPRRRKIASKSIPGFSIISPQMFAQDRIQRPVAVFLPAGPTYHPNVLAAHLPRPVLHVTGKVYPVGYVLPRTHPRQAVKRPIRIFLNACRPCRLNLRPQPDCPELSIRRAQVFPDLLQAHARFQRHPGQNRFCPIPNPVHLP